MTVKQFTLQTDANACRIVLADLFDKFMDPAFGTLPKKEVDLLIFEALEKVGYVDEDSNLYDLVTLLRVTKTKARNLVYDQELRRMDSAQLDKKILEALKRPLLQKQGDLFLLQIENPLVSDHLKSKIQKLQFASDGSFSPDIIKLSLNAITALVENVIPEEQRELTRNALIAAGAPDTSFKGVLKSTIKALARRYAQDTGEALVDNVSQFLSPLLDGALETVTEKAADIFSEKE